MGGVESTEKHVNYTIDQLVGFWCKKRPEDSREEIKKMLLANKYLRDSTATNMYQENQSYNETKRFLDGNERLSFSERMQRILESMLPKNQQLKLGQSIKFDYIAPSGQKIRCSLIIGSKGIIIVPGGFLPITEKFPISLPKDGWFQIGGNGLQMGPVPWPWRGLAKIAGLGTNIQNGNFNIGLQDGMLPKIFGTIDRFVDDVYLKSLRESYNKNDKSSTMFYMERFKQEPPNSDISLAWVKQKENIDIA